MTEKNYYIDYMQKKNGLKSAVDVLTHARNLIAKQGWSQGANARDIDGKDVSPLDETAHCFCSFGAILRSCKDVLHNNVPDWVFVGLVRSVVYPKSENGDLPLLIDWNDDKENNKEKVVAAFNETIRMVLEFQDSQEPIPVRTGRLSDFARLVIDRRPHYREFKESDHGAFQAVWDTLTSAQRRALLSISIAVQDCIDLGGGVVHGPRNAPSRRNRSLDSEPETR